MKFAMIGALMITLPATAALVYALITGHELLMYAALASFLLNTIPFVAAGFLMRKQHDNPDLGH
jgi:hypothetical protein